MSDVSTNDDQAIDFHGFGGSSGGAGASGSWNGPPEPEELTIVFSPAQLAAVLNRIDLSPNDRYINRFFGGGQLFLSALQIVGGVGMLLAPDPTLITKAGGSILIAHGFDSAVAGGRQLWTGQPTKDLTQTFGENTAKGLGASDNAAKWAGIALDVAVPIGASIAMGVERVLAVRAGRIFLEAEEAAGGHTLAKHVGQTESELRARLAREPNITAASTFNTLRGAANAISEAIRHNEPVVTGWARAGGKGNLRLQYTPSSTSNLGKGVVRATGKFESMHRIQIVLKQSKTPGRAYFVLTAYPIP